MRYEYVVRTITGFSQYKYESIINEYAEKGYYLYKMNSMPSGSLVDGGSILVFRRRVGKDGVLR